MCSFPFLANFSVVWKYLITTEFKDVAVPISQLFATKLFDSSFSGREIMADEALELHSLPSIDRSVTVPLERRGFLSWPTLCCYTSSPVV